MHAGSIASVTHIQHVGSFAFMNYLSAHALSRAMQYVSSVLASTIGMYAMQIKN